MGTRAAIDCGTNSTRLLIVDAQGTTLDRRMEITRLGRGVDAEGRLDRDAVDRTLGVLAQFTSALDEFGVERENGRLVATSAVRDAANGAEFLRAAEATTGLVAELLTGDEEGRTAFLGATIELDADSRPNLVVDIGGGSTELAYGHDGLIDVVSLDIGCVRLTERYLRSDPPTPIELESARKAIAEVLDDAVAAIPALKEPEPLRLIGLAGTVSTLGALDQGLRHYERDLIHHYQLDRSAVTRWCTILASENVVDRASRLAVAPGREDVIVGGALILTSIMELVGAQECLVSEADILDGLVASIPA